MNFIQAIILGVIQGFTEFLPVSSSGHLALLHNYFGEQSIAFDVAVHFATLLAILVYFAKDIWLIIKKLNIKYILYIIIGSIPIAILGLLVRNTIDVFFSNLLNIGLGFVISGMFLFVASFSDRLKIRGKRLNWKNSFIIGLSQAIAIFPGVSRSGATVSTGLLNGLDREKAIKFSFLLAIPAIFGANLLKVNEIAVINFNVLIFGFISAFIFGLIGIFVFMKYLTIKRMRWFAVYCWLMALISLILLLLV